MWLTLAGAILIEVCATLCLRASDGFRKKVWIAPMLIGYLASFTLLSVTLSLGMPVGVAYGVWSAAGVALIAVIARVLFAEPLTPLMMGGIGLIIAGVLTIELTRAADRELERAARSPVRPPGPSPSRRAVTRRRRSHRRGSVSRGTPPASAR